MKNILFIAVSLLIITSCKTQQKAFTQSDYDLELNRFMNVISKEQLKIHLYTYASDEFEGRKTGEPGQKKAVNYLREYYKSINVPPAPDTHDYFQTVPKSYITRGNVKNDSENVLAYIEGSEFPDEVIVVSAHLDHIGIENGKINNGADDDGSGTVAIMEMAHAMQHATDKGYRPRRSVLFLHVTGEELGLWGSKYYSENPIFPLKNTVANLNIDMIGRVDENNTYTPDYIYPIGSSMLSKDLNAVLEKMNTQTVNLALDYRYDDLNDPNRFYYRSDHYNFAKHNIPVIFFFNGVHEDYHKPTDTVEKINYPLLKKRTQLIFAVLWELANRNERIKLNPEAKD